MTDEVMDGYTDIYDQLVETDVLELRDVARRNEVRVDALCALLYDLYGRSGVDDAIDDCREHMEPSSVLLLDSAISRGRQIAHG